jgi:hypothetical protein
MTANVARSTSLFWSCELGVRPPRRGRPRSRRRRALDAGRSCCSRPSIPALLSREPWCVRRGRIGPSVWGLPDESRRRRRKDRACAPARRRDRRLSWRAARNGSLASHFIFGTGFRTVGRGGACIAVLPACVPGARWTRRSAQVTAAREPAGSRASTGDHRGPALPAFVAAVRAAWTPPARHDRSVVRGEGRAARPAPRVSELRIASWTCSSTPPRMSCCSSPVAVVETFHRSYDRSFRTPAAWIGVRVQARRHDRVQLQLSWTDI